MKHTQFALKIIVLEHNLLDLKIMFIIIVLLLLVVVVVFWCNDGLFFRKTCCYFSAPWRAITTVGTELPSEPSSMSSSGTIIEI